MLESASNRDCFADFGFVASPEVGDDLRRPPPPPPPLLLLSLFAVPSTFGPFGVWHIWHLVLTALSLTNVHALQVHSMLAGLHDC